MGFDTCFEVGGLCAQVVVSKVVKLSINLVNLVDIGIRRLMSLSCFVPKNFGQEFEHCVVV
jgi:hypothetical protein